MNFLLGGNSIYRLFFYLVYQLLSCLENIKVIKNLLKKELKRVYIGKIENKKILFRFEDIGILRDIFIEKVYWVKELNECKSIIDAGAHIGGFSLFLLSNNPAIKRIVCIEPEVNNFKILSRNLKGFCKDIKLLRVAVSNRSSLGKLYLNEFSAAHTLKQRYKKPKYQTIKVEKLDNIVKNCIDLIKIDVEGSEIKVIDGMRKIIKSYKPILLVETGHFKNETKIIVRKLKKNRYECRILNKKEPIIHAYPRK